MTFHTGALSFWMTMVSVADCVGAAIVFGTLTFARIVSTRWAFGNFAAVAGAGKVKGANPLALVAAVRLSTVPSIHGVLIHTGRPAGWWSSASCRVAGTAAVAPGRK